MIKIDVEKKDSNIEVKLHINKEEWKEILSEAKKELMENLEIKGFRKGMVPENIAERNISNQQIHNGAINKALNKHYGDAIDKIKDEKIITKPEIKIDVVTDDEAIIKIISTIFPKVKLGDYKNIKVSYTKPEVSEEEIKAEFKQTQQLFEKTIEIDDENYQTKKGDIVNINFNGTLEGKEFEGGKAENFDLELGSKAFVGDFEEQLIGLKIGESKKIKVLFPKQYPAENLQGKEVDFEVKINKISKKEQIKGEELKTKLKEFNLSSIKELKDRIKKLLLERKEGEANDNFFKKFIEEVKNLDGTNLKVPEALLKQEIDNEFASFKQKLVSQNMELKEYLNMLNISEVEFKEKNLKVAAENRIKDGLIYSKLIEDLKIELSETDFDEEFKRISELQNTDVEDVKTQINKEMLRNTLLFRKLIEEIKR